MASQYPRPEVEVSSDGEDIIIRMSRAHASVVAVALGVYDQRGATLAEPAQWFKQELDDRLVYARQRVRKQQYAQGMAGDDLGGTA